MSISECTFPQSEKLAIVKLILKGNRNRQNFSSYSPVSNLSILSQVLEDVILDQLLEYLVCINVLPDTQSAYTRLHSTQTVLCNVTNNLIDLMDEGKCGVLVMSDLSGAFDTVVHEILLQDLEAIGVTQQALHYLESYLSDRNFSVQVGNVLSEHCPLRRGVPQGSVLGPTLFCIYTIELSNLLCEHGVTFNHFADDTQFYLSMNNVVDTEHHLNSVMTVIKDWMDVKQQNLNGFNYLRRALIL